MKRSTSPRRGHGPIQPELQETMAAVASAVDEIFNGPAKGADKQVAFVLLTAKFGQIDGGRVNYISNGEREDIIAMMKETIARFEGRVIETGGLQ